MAGSKLEKNAKAPTFWQGLSQKNWQSRTQYLTQVASYNYRGLLLLLIANFSLLMGIFFGSTISH